MASRTNKQWIFKKKQQLEKLKSLKKTWQRYLKNRNLSEEEKISKWLIFELENPKWHKFFRDKSWRKIICKYTWLREDPDWYRMVFRANSQEAIFKHTWANARLRKFLRKSR